MAQYKVLHGSFKTASGLFGAGLKDSDGNALDVIELPEKEVPLLDPSGLCLVLKSKWEVQQKGEAAKAKAIKEAEAEVAAAESKKGGAK